jgi:hypothetical protein
MDRDEIPVRDPDVVWRVLQDELVIVRPASGEIRVLNAVAALIWRCADGNRSITDLVTQVSDLYAVSEEQARTDVAGFVDVLVAEGWLSLL